jgi:hypothetical protein
MAKKQYKRLTRGYPRSGFSVAFASRVSLWLGPDHLLQVDNAGYTETYKRFHFQDIQAVIVRKTRRHVVWNAILAGLLTLSLLVVIWFGFSPDGSTTAATVFGIIAFCFLLFLLINLALGPTCTCQLRTAVQTEELPALRRVRKTRKVLNQVYPLIAAAQEGEATPPISPPAETVMPPVETPPIKMTLDPNLPPPPPPGG